MYMAKVRSAATLCVVFVFLLSTSGLEGKSAPRTVYREQNLAVARDVRVMIAMRYGTDNTKTVTHSGEDLERGPALGGCRGWPRGWPWGFPLTIH